MRAVLTVLIALTALPALADEVRTYFRDWLVVCRADGFCSANGYVNPHPGGGADADYVLIVGRHAEQSYWEIAFEAVAAFPDDWSDITVSVDGAETTFSPPHDVGAYGSANVFYLLGEKAQAVMDGLMPGTAVEVAFDDESGGAHRAAFSLSGLTAALIFIDDQQNRIGSERVASAPPWGLTPASAASTPQVPQALLDHARGDPECFPFEDIANGRDFEVAQLDDGNTLYLVPCWSAAYNFGWKAYVESGGEFAPQYFANYLGPEIGWTGTTFLVNYSYDPATQTLDDFNKSRGIGDCGSSGSWRWNGWLFRLEEFRYRACDDEPIDEDAEMPDFPVVYTAPPEAR